MVNISPGASQPFDIPQLRILCLALFPILIGLFDFLDHNFLSFLYILAISPLSVVGLVKIFSQLFCSIDSVLCHTEALTFYEVPFVDS